MCQTRRALRRSKALKLGENTQGIADKLYKVQNYLNRIYEIDLVLDDLSQ